MIPVKRNRRSPTSATTPGVAPLPPNLYSRNLDPNRPCTVTRTITRRANGSNTGGEQGPPTLAPLQPTRGEHPPMPTYAAATSTTKRATLDELEKLLSKYGAISFFSGTDEWNHAFIAFKYAGLNILMRV